MAAEIIRVLGYPKFKLSSTEHQELLADYLPFCKTIMIPEPPPVVPDCRDSFDLPFLHLVVAGKANVLLTGDQDLLCLNGKFICPILTAEEFLTRF